MEESNIKVYCRFRPLNESEERRSLNLCMKFESSSTVEIPNESSELLQFTFDKVFPPNSSQQEVYEQAALPIIESVMQGFNGTVFAYGQTSSGKTYTMTGPSLSADHMGIIPRMVNTLFEIISETPDYIEYSVKVSYCEIYLEKFKDLLDTSMVDLKIHEDKTRGVFIEGLTEHYVSSEQDVLELLSLGNGNREVAYTKMNAGSSRSHSLFILTVNQTNSRDYSGKVGKLHLVDLAGSEKVGKTGAAGLRLEEAKNINKSLTVLGQVINALTDGKSTHVPYRDSKLTRILQDSLGGNSKTALIVTCSPSPYNESETISSLRFGVRAKFIRNKAKVNKEYTIAELKVLLSKSQEELEKRAIIIAKLEERLKTNDHTLSDISFSFRLDDEKIDLDEVMAQLEDYKSRITELCESNSNLQQESEYLAEENLMLKNENSKLIETVNLLRDRVKSSEDELMEHENLIEKLVMTKESLEVSLDQMMKIKIDLEKEISKKDTEIYHLKQEMLLAGNTQNRNLNLGQSNQGFQCDNDEVTALKAQVSQLESAYKSALKASNPEIAKKNEEFLKASLVNEQKKWVKERDEIMKDLENRIQRVIDLEILVDQSKEAYKYLEKNVSRSDLMLIKKNEELEKYIGKLTIDYQREIKLKDKWKLEAEYLQKKLVGDSSLCERLRFELQLVKKDNEDLNKRIKELEDDASVNNVKVKGRTGIHVKRMIKGGISIPRTKSIAVTDFEF